MKTWIYLVLVAALSVVLDAPVMAQAEIDGRPRAGSASLEVAVDTHPAYLPKRGRAGAKVRVRNLVTGGELTGVTDRLGRVRFTGLEPGPYRVDVTWDAGKLGRRAATSYRQLGSGKTHRSEFIGEKMKSRDVIDDWSGPPRSVGLPDPEERARILKELRSWCANERDAHVRLRSLLPGVHRSLVSNLRPGTAARLAAAAKTSGDPRARRRAFYRAYQVETNALQRAYAAKLAGSGGKTPEEVRVIEGRYASQRTALRNLAWIYEWARIRHPDARKRCAKAIARVKQLRQPPEARSTAGSGKGRPRGPTKARIRPFRIISAEGRRVVRPGRPGDIVVRWEGAGATYPVTLVYERQGRCEHPQGCNDIKMAVPRFKNPVVFRKAQYCTAPDDKRRHYFFPYAVYMRDAGGRKTNEVFVTFTCITR